MVSGDGFRFGKIQKKGGRKSIFPISAISRSVSSIINPGVEIAQSLTSLSTKRAIQVRARLDPLDRKVELNHCAIDMLPPVATTRSKKAVHVLLCLCNNACKRSLAICCKSRALCPVSRLLSVPI